MEREAFIPVLKPGRSTKYREVWSDISAVLPEPVTYNGQTVNPGDVRVIEVHYSNADIRPEQPWTIIWLHVELLNDAIQVPDFSWKPIKRVETGPSVRLGHDELFAKAMQERAAMLQNLTPDTVG